MSKVPRSYETNVMKLIKADGLCYELSIKDKPSSNHTYSGNTLRYVKSLLDIVTISGEQLYKKMTNSGNGTWTIGDYEGDCAYELFFYFGYYSSGASFNYKLEFNNDGVLRSLDNAYENNLIKANPLVTVWNDNGYSPYPVENLYKCEGKKSASYPMAHVVFMPSEGNKLSKVNIEVSGVSSNNYDRIEINRIHIVDILPTEEYQEPVPDLVEDGLICYLDGLDGNNEDKTHIWIDRSGNNHNMELFNLGFSESSGWKDGKLILNGKNNYGLISNLEFNYGTVIINRKIPYLKDGNSYSGLGLSIEPYPVSNSNNNIILVDYNWTGKNLEYYWNKSSVQNDKNRHAITSNHNNYLDGIITLTRKPDGSDLFLDVDRKGKIEHIAEDKILKYAYLGVMSVENPTYMSMEIESILIYDRVLEISEIEKVVKYLKSDRSSFITNKIESKFEGINGSNLDKVKVWKDSIDSSRELELFNLKYNENSGFVYNRLRLDGVSDYLGDIRGDIKAISFAVKKFSSVGEKSYIFDVAISDIQPLNNGEEIIKKQLWLDSENNLNWINLQGLYINGQPQESTGMMVVEENLNYVFHLNLNEDMDVKIGVGKSLENDGLLKCEIENICIFNVNLTDKEIIASHKYMENLLVKEYVIEDKYLIEDGEDIKTFDLVMEERALSEVPIRYIRSYQEGNTANGGHHWVEIKANNSKSENIALNKPVTSISGTVVSGKPLSLITDGQTSYSSYGEVNGTTKACIQIDLGGSYLIDNIQIWEYYGDTRSYYGTRVEVSQNGVDWITVYDPLVSGIYQATSSGKKHDLKAIKSNVVVSSTVRSVGKKENLSAEMFKRYGVSKSIIGNVGSIRSSLITDDPKVIYFMEDEKKLKLKERGVPYGEIIEMRGYADLSPEYIRYVRGINLTANIEDEKDVLKFACSINNGQTWVTYYQGEWLEILRNNAIIIEKGMTLEEINNLTEAQLKELTERADSFKILWYMQKSKMNSSLNITNIEFSYNTSL